MKLFLFFCITTFLCYSANGLKCLECENPLDAQCQEQKLVHCDSPDDFCADMYYSEKMALWKQCIRKELHDVCEHKIDGIRCTACQIDGCNNLSFQDFKNAIQQSGAQDILLAKLKMKQKENNENMKKVHVVKRVITT